MLANPVLVIRRLTSLVLILGDEGLDWVGTV